ncbi:Helitron helicase [Phytophthora megakarya]|uniref:ATP-dependent DNA helicase n=1 Tax=Phytophthora megakarya TaxID=4795 RepID=A0A225VTT4_9STRA|nr:Helitron helicase [Phytophthora megakarya]
MLVRLSCNLPLRVVVHAPHTLVVTHPAGMAFDLSGCRTGWQNFRNFYFKLVRVATQSIPTSARTTYAFLGICASYLRNAATTDGMRRSTKRAKTWKHPQTLIFFLLAPFEVGETNPDEDRRERNVNALIDGVYPGVGDDNLQDEYFVDRAILAPTNASVRCINEMVAERLTGETKEYLSVSLEGVANPNMFEQEFLNSLNFSGIPPHRIVLKVGTPIIMIRNLNSDAGLEDDDKEFPFKLRRKQFPVVPAFAMTINKTQGQSIHHVGIYLESPVFEHGQLYVALSWVTSRKAIKIAVDPSTIDENGNIHTKNIAYWDFVRNFQEKDAAENIHREGEVRVRKAEYKTLKYVTHYLVSNGKTLDAYGLPDLNTYSDVSAEVDGPPRSPYQIGLEHVTERVDQLNRNQRDVFDQVVRAVEHPVSGEKLFVLDGPGGTGESFLLEQILAHVRSQRKIAIAVASSGIAAILLTGGIPPIRRFVFLSN